MTLCADTALLRPTDHRSWRRNAKGRSRSERVRGLSDGKPLGADGGQVHYPRHVRHQQICEQPQKRLPELVGQQCRHFRLVNLRRARFIRTSRLAPTLLPRQTPSDAAATRQQGTHAAQQIIQQRSRISWRKHPGFMSKSARGFSRDRARDCTGRSALFGESPPRAV